MTRTAHFDILREEYEETLPRAEEKVDITMEQHIRLLIADDAARSRDGLRALLDTLRLKRWSDAGPEYPREVEVVAEAADGREAVRMVEA